VGRTIRLVTALRVPVHRWAGGPTQDVSTMAYFLAVLAALAFAMGSVLQQRGTLQTAAGEGDPRFLAQVVRRPVWIAGALCQLTGWIVQAVALDLGSLIVVQSLTTLSLVFALPLGRRLTGQLVTSRTWLGAAAMVGGLVLFLSVGSPEGGIDNPSASSWWTAGLVVVVLMTSLFFVGRARHGSTKALAFGAAAGIGFALQASVTKVFVDVIGGGIVAILSSWTIYVLIASALVGFALQQSALKTGVLAPALASSNALTLVGSVLLGVAVFDETLFSSNEHALPAILGLALAIIGIATLAGSPAPDVHDSSEHRT
jgi:drug/metabolite transporter (DMT)-like permease